MSKLTGLMTGYGPLYLDLNEIVFIGGPMTKPRQEESRQVGLRGGGFCYVHNTPENCTILSRLLPADAPAMAPKTAPEPLGDDKPKKRQPRLVKPSVVKPSAS